MRANQPEETCGHSRRRAASPPRRAPDLRSPLENKGLLLSGSNQKFGANLHGTHSTAMHDKRKSPLESSATREALIDAAEELMRAEGYAAVTSRRIGARAGVKGPLIHYYFKTMDDLYLALFERVSGSWLDSLRRSFACERPIRTLWAHDRDPERAKIVMEFLALANHSSAVREAIASFTTRARIVQRDGIARHFEGRGMACPIPTSSVPVLMESVSYLLAVETALGISFGHAEAASVVDRVLTWFEEHGCALPADPAGNG
jgi:AcrR family transcriptional regulator